ncbi:hypothetical protein QS306_15790 [Paraburkholderia bonniea]|uniref:hypothetical protein n=1 Tax=Paraburkholderia bonniea TaxID=2152891 RepID=UPI0025737507|nr:hypothetical protein [Paraburkholderia bonniea]WJF91550.1 hypothetical protein QS306_15790 [Paraburkholderia bonniea]WJF94869.1 hypothetical protein QS308_15795 [Paraburkholderia bonniea]
MSDNYSINNSIGINNKNNRADDVKSLPQSTAWSYLQRAGNAVIEFLGNARTRFAKIFNFNETPFSKRNVSVASTSQSSSRARPTQVKEYVNNVLKMPAKDQPGELKKWRNAANDLIKLNNTDSDKIESTKKQMQAVILLCIKNSKTSLAGKNSEAASEKIAVQMDSMCHAFYVLSKLEKTKSGKQELARLHQAARKAILLGVSKLAPNDYKQLRADIDKSAQLVLLTAKKPAYDVLLEMKKECAQKFPSSEGLVDELVKCNKILKDHGVPDPGVLIKREIDLLCFTPEKTNSLKESLGNNISSLEKFSSDFSAQVKQPENSASAQRLEDLKGILQYIEARESMGSNSANVKVEIKDYDFNILNLQNLPRSNSEPQLVSCSVSGEHNNSVSSSLNSENSVDDTGSDISTDDISSIDESDDDFESNKIGAPKIAGEADVLQTAFGRLGGAKTADQLTQTFLSVMEIHRSCSSVKKEGNYRKEFCAAFGKYLENKNPVVAEKLLAHLAERKPIFEAALKIKDMPQNFKDKCQNIIYLIDNFNGELKKNRTRCASVKTKEIYALSKLEQKLIGSHLGVVWHKDSLQCFIIKYPVNQDELKKLVQDQGKLDRQTFYEELHLDYSRDPWILNGLPIQENLNGKELYDLFLKFTNNNAAQAKGLALAASQKIPGSQVAEGKYFTRAGIADKLFGENVENNNFYFREIDEDGLNFAVNHKSYVEIRRTRSTIIDSFVEDKFYSKNFGTPVDMQSSYRNWDIVIRVDTRGKITFPEGNVNFSVYVKSQEDIPKIKDSKLDFSERLSVLKNYVQNYWVESNSSDGLMHHWKALAPALVELGIAARQRHTSAPDGDLETLSSIFTTIRSQISPELMESNLTKFSSNLDDFIKEFEDINSNNKPISEILDCADELEKVNKLEQFWSSLKVSEDNQQYLAKLTPALVDLSKKALQLQTSNADAAQAKLASLYDLIISKISAGNVEGEFEEAISQIYAERFILKAHRNYRDVNFMVNDASKFNVLNQLFQFIDLVSDFNTGVSGSLNKNIFNKVLRRSLTGHDDIILSKDNCRNMIDLCDYLRDRFEILVATLNLNDQNYSGKHKADCLFHFLDQTVEFLKENNVIDATDKDRLLRRTPLQLEKLSPEERRLIGANLGLISHDGKYTSASRVHDLSSDLVDGENNEMKVTINNCLDVNSDRLSELDKQLSRDVKGGIAISLNGRTLSADEKENFNYQSLVNFSGEEHNKNSLALGFAFMQGALALVTKNITGLVGPNDFPAIELEDGLYKANSDNKTASISVVDHGTFFIVHHTREEKQIFLERMDEEAEKIALDPDNQCSRYDVIIKITKGQNGSDPVISYPVIGSPTDSFQAYKFAALTRADQKTFEEKEQLKNAPPGEAYKYMAEIGAVIV